MTGTPSPLPDLLAECATRDIRLSLAADDGLTVDAPRDALTPDLMARLKMHKAELLASLRPQPETNKSTTVESAHPLATFVWDSGSGYFPCRQIIRRGIEHKREDCSGRTGWRHVWGGVYCETCWPCTDPKAMVPPV